MNRASWIGSVWYRRVPESVRLSSGSFVANGVSLLAAFGLQVFLANLLGVSEYGAYAYAMAWAMLLATVSKMGLDSATLRFFPQYVAKADWQHLRGFRRFALVAAAGGAVFIAVVAGLCSFTADDLAGRAFRVALLLVPLLTVLELVGSMLQALKRPARYQLAYGVTRVFTVALIVFAGSQLGVSTGATFAVSANIVAGCVVLVILAGYLRAAWPAAASQAIPRHSQRGWIAVAWPLFLVAVSQLALARADVLLVGALSGSESVGVYAVVNQIAMLVSFGIAAANTVMAPTISELYTRGDRAGLQRAVKANARAVLAYTAPVCVVLVLFGKQILAVFGPEFVTGYGAMLLLSAGQFVIAFFGPVGFLLTMTEHQRTALRIILVFAVLQIVLCVVAIPRFGLMGAAAASGACNACRSATLAWVVQRRIQISGRAF